MSQIFRVFIRHENDTHPAYIKVRSEKSADEFLQEIQEVMSKGEAAVWRCVDIQHHNWLFRADKIFTVCVYPPEDEAAVLEGGEDAEPETSAVGTDPGIQSVADVRTRDDLDAVE